MTTATAIAAVPVTRRRLPVAVPVAIGLAWAAAVAAHASGFAARFHHGVLLGHGGAPGVTSLAGFAALWTLMIAAMMLPSAVPLLRLFAAASSPQPRSRRVLAFFIAGYLAVWVVFGWVALAFDGAVHRAVDALVWPAAHPWSVTSATLALAGAFQFSPLKEACLDACRHPAAWMLRHYRRGEIAALRMGWGHGLFCLGCCWALMLVMFAAGVSDLRWMAALGALMAYEKIGRHGVAAARTAGAMALALAVAVALHPGLAAGVLAADAG